MKAAIIAVLLAGQGLSIAQDAPATAAASVSSPDTAALQLSDAQEKALRERVLGRWNAMIARDLDKAYEFESPAYREKHTVEQFKAEFGKFVQWHMATVQEILYDQPEVAKVRVAVDATIFPPGGGPDVRTVTYVDEEWLMVDNQWWYSSR